MERGVWLVGPCCRRCNIQAQRSGWMTKHQLTLSQRTTVIYRRWVQVHQAKSLNTVPLKRIHPVGCFTLLWLLEINHNQKNFDCLTKITFSVKMKTESPLMVKKLNSLPRYHGVFSYMSFQQLVSVSALQMFTNLCLYSTDIEKTQFHNCTVSIK